MFDSLWALIDGNEFLSGGLLLGALGTVLVMVRQYGMKALSWLWRQCIVTVEFRNSDAPFDWLVVWLDQQPYTKRARRLTVSVNGSSDCPTVEPDLAVPERPKVMFSPAVGTHVFLHNGRFLWLSRDRQETSKDNWRERESFNIRMVGRSQDHLRRLLEDAYDTYALTIRQQSRIYLSVYSYWVPQGFVRPRPLDSVYLPVGQKELMYSDLQQFLKSESWYHKMGIPYRRGYLLHGVPGSGKSSLVAAAAGAAGMHLYVVNLPGMTDQGLQELLRNVSAPRAIVLFEDIDGAYAAQTHDCVADDKTRKSDVLTVSGLLNALDGVASRDGYVTIMTTNRREKLDPALIRPGRVDLQFEFDYAIPEQAQALYRHFYGESALARHGDTLVAAMPDNVSMATLQGHFLRHRDDPTGGAALHRIRTETSGLKVVGNAQ